jgi:hypothetical protein
MSLPNILLHHYTSGNGLLGIFNSGQIWATSIHSLNDSREFVHAVGLAKSAIGKAIADSGDANAKSLFDPVVERLESMSRIAIYVTCFSTVEDSLSQWRGYCPPAFGYSIGFDGELLRKVAEPQGFQLAPCIYKWAEQQEIAKGWAERTISHLLPGLAGAAAVKTHVGSNVSPFLREFVGFAPYFKNPNFADEREWRLAGIVALNDPRMCVRPARSMLVRYLPIELNLNKVDPLIWSICVGPTPHPELAVDAVTHYFTKIRITNGVGASKIPYRDW